MNVAAIPLRYLKAFLTQVVLLIALFLQAGPLLGQDVIASERAVELAERFARENGYTDAPDSVIKSKLDFESIEWSDGRDEMLKGRRNTLRAKAVGVKADDGGWGVAFDYANQGGGCRVVTMQKDGSELRMQHKDGVREYWLGFDKQ